MTGRRAWLVLAVLAILGAACTPPAGDRTPPVLDLPDGVSVTATGAGGAVATWVASATDAVDGPVPVTCTPPSGSVFAVGVTPVSCTATDAAGNAATGGFTVTVGDVPWLVPGCYFGDGARVEYLGPEGVRDNLLVSFDGGTTCDGTGIPITLVRAVPNTADAALATCREVLATENAANVAGFGLPVDAWVCFPDTSAPALTLPRDVLVGSTGGSAVVDFTATAVDGAAQVPVSCVPPSGTAFPLGTTQVVCTAADDAGNTTTGTFDVTVTDGPRWRDSGCDGGDFGDLWFSGAEDVAGNAEWHRTSSDATCAGFSSTTTVVRADEAVAALDECRSLTPTRNVERLAGRGYDTFPADGWWCFPDEFPPTMVLPPAVYVSADGPAVATFPAAGFDLVAGVVPATCSPASGSVFPLGVTEVSCSATDPSGNTASGSFTVTVEPGSGWFPSGCTGRPDLDDLFFTGREDTVGNLVVHQFSTGSTCSTVGRATTLVRAADEAAALALCGSLVPGTTVVGRPLDESYSTYPADAWRCGPA